MSKTKTVTVTLEVPQTWENAAWYEKKQIDVAWIQEMIENGLSHIEEHNCVSFEGKGKEFQTHVTAFREEQAKHQQAQDALWADPEYAKAQWDMLRGDDLQRMQACMEKNGKATGVELDDKALRVLCL